MAANAAKSDDPAVGYKCRACLKRTKVRWYKALWSWIVALWVYYRLSGADRLRVKELMKNPELVRTPNRPEPYRFWCVRCKKLVKDKNVVPAATVDIDKGGPIWEDQLGVRFIIHCHGERFDYWSSMVEAYSNRPCHLTLWDDLSYPGKS